MKIHFDKHQIEFGTLDSKTAKRIMKIMPAKFKRKINCLEETLDKNERPMLTGRRIVLQVFLFCIYNIKKTRGHTMNLSDFLDVELNNNNQKMFNQAWEETLSVLGSDVVEHVLENFYERQVKKSTPMKHAMTFYQEDIVVQKEARTLPKMRTIVTDIFEQQQQNMLIFFKKSDQETAAAAYSSKGAEEKGKDCRSWMTKRSCSKGGKSSFEHDPAKKGKAKGNRSTSTIKRDNSAELEDVRKTA